jgi:nucleotide-binding universal stress UspA family protein
MVDGTFSLKKILVPTDGQAHSVRACQYAVKLAKLTGAEIIGIHVMPSQVSRIFEERRHSGEISSDFVGQYRKEGAEHLKQIEKICVRENVRRRTLLLEGYPPEEILKTAQKENASLIVLGIRKRSRFERHFGVTTSDKIILNANCPVTIINAPW